MTDGPEHPRRRRRTLSRRLHLQRRRRQRRILALALGVALLAILATAVAGLRDGTRHVAIEPESSPAPPVSALERNREPDTREAQAQALQDVLGYTNFLRHGESRAPEVALTFDDGPGPYTDEILSILRKHDAPATFFVLGDMVESFPGMVDRELRQGHAVGIHTYDHPHMGQLDVFSQAHQLSLFDSVMEARGLSVPPLFRPPYGSFDDQTLRLLDARGDLMVLWSVDTGDYENPGWDVIAQRALDGAEPGAVILLHDAGGDRAQTIVALPLILQGLKERGLKPVTVPQLLVDDPPPPGQSIERATAVEPPGQGLPAAAP